MNNNIKRIILNIAAAFFEDKAVGAIGSAFAGTVISSALGSQLIAIPVYLMCYIIYASASNKSSESDSKKISNRILGIIKGNSKQLDEIRNTEITNLSHILETELKLKSTDEDLRELKNIIIDVIIF